MVDFRVLECCLYIHCIQGAGTRVLLAALRSFKLLMLWSIKGGLRQVKGAPPYLNPPHLRKSLLNPSGLQEGVRFTGMRMPSRTWETNRGEAQCCCNSSNDLCFGWALVGK